MDGILHYFKCLWKNRTNRRSMQIRQLLSLKVHGERFLVGQIQVRFQVLGDVLLVLWNKQCSEEIDRRKGSNIFLDYLGLQYTEFSWVFSKVRLLNQLLWMHYSDYSRVKWTFIYLSLGREEIHQLTRKNTSLSLLSKPEQGKMVFYFMRVGHRQKASNSLSNVLPSPLWNNVKTFLEDF